MRSHHHPSLNVLFVIDIIIINIVLKIMGKYDNNVMEDKYAANSISFGE
jgi:hypothetical protein